MDSVATTPPATVAQSGEQPTGRASSGADDSLLSCLILVSRAHGGNLTPDAAMAGLPVGAQGLTPSMFERAARRGGLSSSVVKRALDKLNAALFPAILLLDHNQACVLIGWADNGKIARVMFPELGEAVVDMPLAELERRYIGRAIYARPRFRFDARVTTNQQHKDGHWFWGAMWENKGLYRDVMVAAALINIFALGMPLFVLNVYDRVVPNAAFDTLWALALGIVIVQVGDLLLRNLRSYFVDQAAARVDTRVSTTILERVMGMRLEHRPASVGSFSANLRNFERVRTFLSSGVVIAFIDLPFAFLFISVIYWIAPPMLPVFVAAILALIAYALVVQKRMRELAVQSRRAGAQRNATLVESLVGLETIKAVGAEGTLQRRWEETASLVANSASRLRTAAASATHVTQWIQHVVGVIVVVIGVFMISENALSMGGLIACYLLSRLAMGPFGRVASMMIQYHKAKDAFSSVDSVMQMEVERPEGSVFINRDHFDGKISFRNVGFRYPKSDLDVLKDISFVVSPGEHVAILGRVGSGKTTLEKLILGLYRPTAGEVLIDDIDIRQLDPGELRRSIGYVPQDVTLFYGTLRDNLAMAFPLADDSEILQAARIGGILPMINRHPHGFAMQVGERGDRLSGGQRQGIAVARAVLGVPSILLLDEPTSSMDRETESAVRKELRAFASGRTMIVVTHRTSLLEMVDRVIVLDEGQIVADGPKAEVVKAMKEGRIRKIR